MLSYGRTLRCLGLLAVVAGALAFTSADRRASVPGLQGRVAPVKPSVRPAVAAAFRRESYAAGEVARLVIASAAHELHVRLYRAGTETERIDARDEMRGTPVGSRIAIGTVARGRVVRLGIGAWPSGLYYARLSASGGRIGYAPFVLKPHDLGEHRVAVVLPTFTWQAYNRRDDDRDGYGDTWYAARGERLVRLGRPYENRGVPPHYKFYDQPFIRWLVSSGRTVDYLSDSDLDAVRDGADLARHYSLLIFPGHHEYVTMREFDVVKSFRDHGGNLMFLSANNFFWQVALSGNGIRRIAKFRDIGRPEASLIGVQYVGNDSGERRAAWRVRSPASVPWLFAGTSLVEGSVFSSGGIEIDAVAPSSPAGIQLVAEIPNLLGRRSAHMTYYETDGGARVFAAGAFTLAGAVWKPTVRKLMENLWSRLAEEAPAVLESG